MGKVVVRGEFARQQALEIVKKGGTWKEAAEKTGFGYNYIRQLCAKAGLYVPKKQAKSNDELLMQMVNDGASIESIQEAIGYSNGMCVRAACKRLGIKYPDSQQKIERDRERKVIVYKEQPSFFICPVCRNVFYSYRANSIFCSIACQKRENHQRNDYKRKKKVSLVYIDDISLDELYKKENGICYLCGEKCDFSDFKWIDGHKHVFGDYPSRDHVKPLSKGGIHSWENVRLAHIKCNSSKGVRYG